MVIYYDSTKKMTYFGIENFYPLKLYHEQRKNTYGIHAEIKFQQHHLVHHQYTKRVGNLVCRQSFFQEQDIHLPLGKDRGTKSRSYQHPHQQLYPFPLAGRREPQELF